MKTALAIAIAAMMCIPHTLYAADKSKSVAQIESARTALHDFKTRAGDSTVVAPDLEEAAKYLERAAAALKAGEKMFGGISDEAELDVRHETALVDLTLKLAASRLERARTEAESAALGKKIDTVKARLKIFDDFRAEIARLKEEVAANGKIAKELEALKGEKKILEEQITKLSALQGQLDAVKEENQKLTRQLEQSETARKEIPPQPIAAAPVKKEVAAPVKKNAPQNNLFEQPAKPVKPAVPPQPQREIETAPSNKGDDAAPPAIAPAEDPKAN
jgi:chromosome segregation ATPase